MKKLNICFGLILIYCLIVGSAKASCLGVAGNYNLFALSDLTATSDSQGSVASGGNVTFKSYSVGSSIGSAAKLVVNGNLNWTSAGTVGTPSAPDGSIYVGGTYSIPKWSIGYGKLYTVQDQVDFKDASKYLNQASTSWGNLKANGTAVNEWGTLTLKGSNENLNVFSLKADDLARKNMSSMNIVVPDGSTVLINVSGDSVEMKNFSTTLSGLTQNKLLFNFYEATQFTLSGCEFEGSILAPLANMNFISGSMNGTLIDYTHRGGGEMHNYIFTGNLPSVPEPITLVCLVGGMVSLISLKRRI